MFSRATDEVVVRNIDMFFLQIERLDVTGLARFAPPGYTHDRSPGVSMKKWAERTHVKPSLPDLGHTSVGSVKKNILFG